MKEEDKILNGKLFDARCSELLAIKNITHNLCTDYNRTYEDEADTRNSILDRILKKQGSGTYFQGPIYFNYGKHTTIGDDFFCNYNVMISDDAEVTIGDRVMFGPNCTLATPSHPMIAAERYRMTDSKGHTFHPCMAKPIVIGNDVWLASGVIVCGGVTIGNGSVIGAGSVVTKDVPDHVFAAGNPCRVIRAITECDSMKNLLI